MESEESFVTFMNFDEVLLMMSDFENKGEMVMVSQISSFDMNPIQVIVMPNFFSPNLGDMRVFPFVANSVMSMVVNFTEVFQNKIVNNDFFVSHEL